MRVLSLLIFLLIGNARPNYRFEFVLDTRLERPLRHSELLVFACIEGLDQVSDTRGALVNKVITTPFIIHEAGYSISSWGH